MFSAKIRNIAEKCNVWREKIGIIPLSVVNQLDNSE